MPGTTGRAIVHPTHIIKNPLMYNDVYYRIRWRHRVAPRYGGEYANIGFHHSVYKPKIPGAAKNSRSIPTKPLPNDRNP